MSGATGGQSIITKKHWPKSWLVLTSLLAFLGPLAPSVHADGTGLARKLSPYRIEFEPIVGIDLPYDIWGTPGLLNVVGLRTSLSVSDPGAIEVSILYQSAGPDHAYTLDASYRHEIRTDYLTTFFNIGAHYSIYRLTLDYDAAGNCVPANCQTDSGAHNGISVGGGLIIPFGASTPLKLAMRFYREPTLWLLIEAGIGIRF